jgi:hypothetical protein
MLWFITTYLLDEMDVLEEYNAPSDIKYYEVVYVHDVKNNESKTLAYWKEIISVLVGEDELEYALDVQLEDDGNHASFLYYNDTSYDRNDIECNNLRDHYVIKVVLVNSVEYDRSQEDNSKTFQMKHIMIAKRRYELL